MVPSSPSTAWTGRPELVARVRRLKEEDVQAALESPPQPTFTVPAFRARKHRGGESPLLKDAYPSGFCKPPEIRPLPTTTVTASSDPTTSGNNISAGAGGPWLREVLHESKEVGISPWGACSGRRTLNFTRVLFGATDVADTVGSALVQYGPGFSIGPAESLSPRRRWSNRSDHRRPRTPSSPSSPSHMTIDGSFLRDRNSLLVEPCAVDQGKHWPQRKVYAPDWTSPRDGDGNRGHKRIRPATDRVQSPGEPEPWPCATEELTGRSSRPSTANAAPQSLSANRANCPADNGMAAGPHVRDEGDQEQARDRDHGAKEDAAAAAAMGGACGGQQAGTFPLSPHLNDSGGARTDSCGKEDKNDQSRCGTSMVEGALDISLAKVPCDRNQEVGAMDFRDERSARLPGEVIDEDDASDSVRLGEAWAIDANDNPSVWSNCSARLLASVATNDSSAVYNSSVGEGSADLASAKRSFSTLDAERYRGSLSKDANEILRSHLRSRNELPGQATYSFSDSHHEVANEATAILTPAPPPPSTGQLLDNLLAVRGPQSPPFHLPPMARSPETCYVRTRGDLVLAVVRKRDLLECVNDVSFRSLKTAAYPVRIKADMTLPEGLRAILASGVLRDDAAENDSGSLIGRRRSHVSGAGSEAAAEAGSDMQGTSGQAQSLEYFNSQEGTWDAVRNESDWKILLAAPAGPQGAGVAFQSAGAGANGRRADFLVAITPTRPLPSSEVTRPSKIHAPSPYAWSKVSRKPNAARQASTEKPFDWRYATSVTPGVLTSLRTSNGEMSDPKDETRTQVTAKVIEGEGSDALHQRLAELDGPTRITGPGPGAALWMTMSTTTNRKVPKGAADSPPHRPRKDKVRRLVRHLEAGLVLKGRPVAGGLPAGSQKIDMPYTKELAKWSYDEILGIPRTTTTVSA